MHISSINLIAFHDQKRPIASNNLVSHFRQFIFYGRSFATEVHVYFVYVDLLVCVFYYVIMWVFSICSNLNIINETELIWNTQATIPKVLFFSPIVYGIQDVFMFTNLNWHVGIFIQKQNKHSLKTPIISMKESEL